MDNVYSMNMPRDDFHVPYVIYIWQNCTIHIYHVMNRHGGCIGHSSVYTEATEMVDVNAHLIISGRLSPDPVRPTMPIFSFGRIWQEMFLRTRGNFGRYRTL